MRACADVDARATPGRRLPTYAELSKAFDFDQVGAIAPGGEFTTEVYPSSANPGEVAVLVMTDEVGRVALIEDRAGNNRAFRCVSDPMN